MSLEKQLAEMEVKMHSDQEKKRFPELHKILQYFSPHQHDKIRSFMNNPSLFDPKKNEFIVGKRNVVPFDKFMEALESANKQMKTRVSPDVTVELSAQIISEILEELIAKDKNEKQIEKEQPEKGIETPLAFIKKNQGKRLNFQQWKDVGRDLIINLGGTNPIWPIRGYWELYLLKRGNKFRLNLHNSDGVLFAYWELPLPKK